MNHITCLGPLPEVQAWFPLMDTSVYLDTELCSRAVSLIDSGLQDLLFVTGFPGQRSPHLCYCTLCSAFSSLVWLVWPPWPPFIFPWPGIWMACGQI